MPGTKTAGPSIKWPELYEKLISQGKSKESAARISNAAWRKKGAAKLKKHTPGGKPHDQDEHGNWADQFPEGADNLLPGGAGQGEAMTSDTNYEGVSSNLTITGERFSGDDALTIKAFDNFEKTYPGHLPEELTVVFNGPNTMGPPAFAWIEPFAGGGVNSAVVNVNDESWFDMPKLTEDLLFAEVNDITWQSTADTAASLVGPDQKLDTYLEAIMFHEMAHTVAADQGWQWRWPADLPQYSPQWYDGEIWGDDPSIASDYAASSAPEYFAEAFVEVRTEGTNASPLAQQLVEMVDSHIGGTGANLGGGPSVVSVREAIGLFGVATVERMWQDDQAVFDAVAGMDRLGIPVR